MMTREAIEPLKRLMKPLNEATEPSRRFEPQCNTARGNAAPCYANLPEGWDSTRFNQPRFLLLNARIVFHYSAA